MKLKNRNNGVIGDLVAYDADKGIFAVKAQGGDRCYYYSLAALHEVWEDAPEEKSFWHINEQGSADKYPSDLIARKSIIRKYKEIGNYFETEEEAEKAAEKLKAFKRLKHKGFRFEPVDRYEALCGNGFNIPITATMPPEAYTDVEVSKDLDILFGGKE